MKQKYLVLVLLSLIIASSATSLSSYRATEQIVENDLNQALNQALAELQSDVITQDTIRTFNSHLQIAELRGKATIAVDTKGRQFKAYASCSQATIFSLSDQRPTAILWTITLLWATFCVYRFRQHTEQTSRPLQFGGLSFADNEKIFYNVQGQPIKLTPMQQQLMEMFFTSSNHQLSKTEICDTLWPKKPDANETLYTLIRRLKPVIEQNSNLKIESDRGKAYRLTRI